MLTLKTRTWLISGVIALAAAFAFGRACAPAKVETKEVEHVVYQDRVVEKVVTVHVQDEAKKVVVWRDRVVTPDGTVHEKEIEQTDTSKHEAAATQEVKVETKYVDRMVEKTKLVEHEAAPWRVSVMGGVDSTLQLDYGASVQRRILGPISAGAWGIGSKSGVAGGLSLGLDL